jgi:putative tryptophan/tyrosine transport system substrate-binding protein
MKRREFIAGVGSATAWPIIARAEPALPVIGYLNGNTSDAYPKVYAQFHRGLGEEGYIEGRNVEIEYRWAGGHFDKMPTMAAELVNRAVAVIVMMGGDQGILAVKAATQGIPIVFATESDPVKANFVASLNRPGDNLTGVSQITASLEPKRFELLRQLVPNASVIGILVDPTYQSSEAQTRELTAAAQAVDQRVVIFKASSEAEIEAAFANFAQQRIGALLVGSDPFFTRLRVRIVTLAARDSLPAIYQWREYTEAGGLMSYGTSLGEACHLVGVYAGRILKGAKPADLPVRQATKVELVINLKTAKALGITFPLSLLGRADEVIE